MPITLDALRRIFHDARPIDTALLVIEVLVLLLIGYEVAHDVSRRWKIHRRMRAIFARMSEGQALQGSVARGADEATVAAWVASVRAWIQETNSFLQRYSSQASASFLHDAGGASIRYHGIPQPAHDWYLTLIQRISNLRNIMEKPDVYF